MERATGSMVMDPYQFPLGELRCSTHTIPQLLDEVRMLLRDKSVQSRVILYLNAHIFNLAWSDARLREILNSARIVAADGMSIVWGTRLVGARMRERCNMTEGFRAFLQTDNMPRNKAVLAGLTEGEACLAGRAIERMSTHCRIVKAISGYLNDAGYEQIFESLSDVDFVFVGAGTPRTEQICEIARVMCPQAIVWGIGGGTVKILAGTMKEAPVFLRRSGLQWLYRLCRDPFRLWRRYLIGNPLFTFRLMRLALRTKRAQTAPRE